MFGHGTIKTYRTDEDIETDIETKTETDIAKDKRIRD
jgi:hypothetical protein